MLRQKDLPRTVEIRGNLWTIHFYRKPPMAERPGEEIFGVCMPRKRRIYIKLGQAPNDRLSTLVHEIFHAIGYEYKINITHRTIDPIEGPIAELVLAFFRAQSRSKGRISSK